MSLKVGGTERSMPNYWKSPYQQAYELGAREAARQHAQLKTDLSKRVDVFRIIEDQRIWLMFQAFGNLFGAYVRLEDAAGIIVHAKHPLSLQRFTAAHELGHYFLGHRPALDDEDQIQQPRRSSDLQEIAAQSFAAHFLMPLELVNHVLRSLGLPLKPGQLTDRQAYLISLQLGVSYSAAVTHLASLGKISRPAMNVLLQRTPKGVKASIGQGTGPEDAWADVWLLDEHDSVSCIYPRVNDELHISLKELPTTGFIWMPFGSGISDLRKDESAVEGENGAYVAVVSERFEPDQPATHGLRFGTSGRHEFVLRLLRPGTFVLRLIKRRPWQPEAPVETFDLNLVVSPKWTGEDDKGLSDTQKTLITLAA